MSEYLFLLLILACPLMMFWMMRGGHGHHSAGDHSGDRVDHDTDANQPSLEELRHRREELDREIEHRQATEGDLRTPVGGSWR
jgi:Protein of unknown function (DUF2933)